MLSLTAATRTTNGAKLDIKSPAPIREKRTSSAAAHAGSAKVDAHGQPETYERPNLEDI